MPAVVFAYVFGLAWVAEHLVEVLVTSAVCGVLALAAVIALMRRADRRDAAPVMLWSARAIPGGAPAAPLPPAGAPAIGYRDIHFHFNGVPDTEQAAMLRQAIGRTP